MPKFGGVWDFYFLTLIDKFHTHTPCGPWT